MASVIPYLHVLAQDSPQPHIQMVNSIGFTVYFHNSAMIMPAVRCLLKIITDHDYRAYADCEFISLCRLFFARRAKITYKRRKNTMLPQARSTFVCLLNQMIQ